MQSPRAAMQHWHLRLRSRGTVRSLENTLNAMPATISNGEDDAAVEQSRREDSPSVAAEELPTLNSELAVAERSVSVHSQSAEGTGGGEMPHIH